MKFTKMQGIGNDYVYVDCTKSSLREPGAIARLVSDRHFGIGSDGLILIRDSEQADFRMDMYNADGSRGEMCGNGIRCVAKYVYDYGLTNQKEITVETLAGIKHLKLEVEKNQVSRVQVDMGEPIFSPEEIPVQAEREPVIKELITVCGRDWEMTCVSMGNPHAVVFISTPVKEFPLEEIGPFFENHSRFPKRTNTEFIRVLGPNRLEMRVWERGSGETMACGTGACASAAAMASQGKLNREAVIHLAGGDLAVRWDEKTGHMFMTGPAVTVFDGETAD